MTGADDLSFRVGTPVPGGGGGSERESLSLPVPEAGSGLSLASCRYGAGRSLHGPARST